MSYRSNIIVAPALLNTAFCQNNVERRYAIHENRLASVKASLSLTAPLRLDFIDKRLSKNYHTRRHQAQVVYDNFKLLRALEDIHSRGGSRSTGDSTSLRDISKRGRSSTTGGGGGDNSRNAAVAVKHASSKMINGKGAGPGSKSHVKKLNTLLARKRDLKAALVARENQKMLEVSHCVAPRLKSMSSCSGIAQGLPQYGILPTIERHRVPYFCV